MLRNYLKTALRSMRRHLAYSIINVLGLTVGLVASFLILLWVQDELNHDTSLENREQIYRVMRTARYGDGQVYTFPAITAKLDGVLDEEFPEIEMAALHSWEQNMAFSRGEVTFRESGRHGGIDYFKILPYPFLAGDPQTALVAPDGVTLSETMARKYFGEFFEVNPDPKTAAREILGQSLRLDNRMDVRVTGVFEDLPANASTRFDFVLPVEEFARRNSWVDDWGNNGLQMYVTLQPGADAAVVSEKIKNLIKERSDDSTSELFLQPLTDIYLRSRFENGVLVGGRIEYVRIFSFVAVFVLLIAGINFTNLATARSALRSLEVGIRKTFGGSRKSLMGQFLGESILLSFFALILALGSLFLLLPGFNSIVNKSISVNLADPSLWLQLFGIALLTGLLAGAYPAIYLSGIRLMEVLRKGTASTGRGRGLRKGLVVFQFVISIVLIVGAMTVYRQIDFIRSKNLGLDRENVIYSRLEGGAAEQYESFRDRLMQSPAITQVASGAQNPLSVGTSTPSPQWDGKDPNDKTLFYIMTAGYDYIETMRMEIVSGRSFSRFYGTDTLNVVINETAAKAMGMENPIGQRLAVWQREGQIIGVVKDFHMTSLYDTIEPTIIRLEPGDPGLLFIRTAVGGTEEAISAFESVFKRFNPEYPFEYNFLDSAFENMYRSEVVIGRLASYFTLLAVFIACLGLFGLASFTAERRMREIAIRKVLGAPVQHIVWLLSNDFLKLIGLAFVIAAPIAYFLMNDWLSEFEFHVSLNPLVFIAAALVLLTITGATIGFQSVKAALANPMNSMRE